MKAIIVLFICVFMCTISYCGYFSGGAAAVEGTTVLSTGEAPSLVLTSDGADGASWETVTVGDVVGPGASVDGDIALFDSTTGKLLKATGAGKLDGVDFAGPTSGPANTIVIGNTPVGLTGAQNTILGVDAGVAMTSSKNSVLIGWRAGQSTTTNSDNVYVGMDAALLWTGSANVVIGANVDSGANSGTKNFVGGSQAALAVTNLGNSVMLGQAAGSSLLTSLNSICIGQDSCDTATTGNYHIGLGSGRPTSATSASQMYVGGTVAHIDELYLGEGGRSASVVGDFAISNSLTTGTDIAGPDLNIIGGRGTGLGVPGIVTINAGVTGVTGTADHAFVQVASFSEDEVKVTTDLAYTVTGIGPVLVAPDAGCWRVTVDNAGLLGTTSITCP